MRRPQPLTIGQTFAGMRVLSVAGTNERGECLYEVECLNCHRRSSRRAVDIRRKHGERCGQCRFDDLTGREFGLLKAVRRVENRGIYTRWFCACACGGGTEVDAHDLKKTKGGVHSCGCLRSASRFIDGEQVRTSARKGDAF